MKKILFSILALVAIATTARAQNVAINDTNFPDEIFRTYVKTKFDTDKDETLSTEEIKAAKEISVSRNVYQSDNYIKSLKGIEFFTSLTYLYCNYHNMGSLDVSNNTELEELCCWYNDLTSLDVSKNTKLTRLECCYNDLTSLDVSKNTKLTQLDCNGNKLTELDVSKNTALKNLDCNGNKLTELDVSKNTALKNLDCNGNKLTELDVSKNTKLTRLDCNINQIKGNKMLALVNSLPTVTEGTGELRVIATKNGNERNVITKSQVDIAKGKGWKVLAFDGTWSEYVGSDDPSGIIISSTNFPDATFRSYVSTNFDTDNNGYLSSEEVAAVKLIYIEEYYEDLVSIKGVEFFTELTQLYCRENNLASIDVSKNKKLEELHCYKNKLTKLDISQNTALTRLDCGMNSLTELNVSANTALTALDCSNNQLTKLDVSQNTALTVLYCSANQLTSLDVSQNTALTTLWCSYNQLTELDVSKNTALTYLSCSSNQINGDKMQALVNSLQKVTSGSFYAINTNNTGEGNVITKEQVALAKSKGWKVYDSYGNKEYAGSVVITATANPAEGGTVEGAGTYEAGKTVTLTATPNKGYKFKQWTYVYKGKKYTDTGNPFVLPNNTADWTLTAYFEKDETTAINTVENGKMTNDNYYSIDGVKLSGEPTKKGVYIIKGKKVKK